MLKKIFSPAKVDLHQERIAAYWRGEHIFPVTMELDLTQCCTRVCEACPFSVSRKSGQTLELPFLDRLFTILGPNTPGLILSGGEPTSVNHYPETLALARAKGFQEISTISNGSCLPNPRVQEALLAYGTAVRVSLYDWQDGLTGEFYRTIKNIENLRQRVDREKSQLQIGVSILTSSALLGRFKSVAMTALEAGAHWVYFHPFCIDWRTPRPTTADQAGVVSLVEGLRKLTRDDSQIQIPLARYEEKELHFSSLHGAHFLLQVGADGVVYAGPECKYEDDYALLDLREGIDEKFLEDPRRLAKISAINSDNYRYIGTKHRPPMFSDYLENSHEQINSMELEQVTTDYIHPTLI